MTQNTARLIPIPAAATTVTTPRRRLASIAPLLCSLLLTPLWLTPATGHAATVQGSGHQASETRNVADFQAIALAGSMDLVLRQGTQQALQVQADDNLLPLLETVVENGSGGATLQIRWKSGSSLYPRGKVVITVTAVKLSRLAAAGSGDIRMDAFSTPALDLVLSGAGDVKFDKLTTQTLGVRISGSGDVAGNGKADKLAISIAGSGDVRLDDLQADDVTVQIAGSGDAAVNAQKTLDVRIAGSGDVSYRGNATVKKSVAGSGSVTRR